MKLALLSPMHLNAPTASPTPPTGGTLAPQTPDAFTPSTKLQRQGFDLSKGTQQARRVLEALEKALGKALKMNEDQYNRGLKELFGFSYGEYIESLKRSQLRLKNFIESPSEATVPEGPFLPLTDLRGYDLSQVKWKEANLTGADLRWTNLIGADLRRTNLKEANLREANLEGANLEGANLSNANLSNANLSNAYLREAKLEEADLREAKLEEASLYLANLTNTNFLRTIGAPLHTSNKQLDEALNTYYVKEFQKAKARKWIEEVNRQNRL